MNDDARWPSPKSSGEHAPPQILRPEKRAPFRLWRIVAHFLALPLALVSTPSRLAAQRVTTVRETEFRTRWSNYQVDRPSQEVTPELRPKASTASSGTSLRSFFQNGPIVLRASLSTGWEYSDERRRTSSTRALSTSSFFAAPAFALLYDREVGAWKVSARYSAGYLYYFDQNFSGSANGGSADGLSQTGGLDLVRNGSRLVLRSSTAGSYGTGYEIDRDQQTTRLSLGETLLADYLLGEFVRVGASAGGNYDHYTTAGGSAIGIQGTDNTQTSFFGKVFGDYFWTGKTGFHLELSSGRESQDTGGTTGFERSYYQGLLGINYTPTGKLTFRIGMGFGVLSETGQRATPADNGTRAVYTLDADYTPTEKISARLHFGLEGTSVKPEFTLALNWHPREFTLVNLSIYQQTGLSTISFAEEQTRRGVLVAIRQRLLQRLDANLSAGVEEQALRNSNGSQFTQSSDPYSFLSATIAWEINRSLAWQVQYTRSTGRVSSVEEGNRSETRASTSLRLTF